MGAFLRALLSLGNVDRLPFNTLCVHCFGNVPDLALDPEGRVVF